MMYQQLPHPRTYAVADLHGRSDLLDLALGAITAHANGEAHNLLFLGDYVDRGPDSSGVIDRLKRLSCAPQVCCLKGNHEALLLDAETGGEAEALWMRNGGDATVASYGLEGQQRYSRRLPSADRKWLIGLTLAARDSHRVYVHAGIEPDVSLAQQSATSILWIRRPFLAARSDALPCHIVHGHTPRWAGKPVAALPEILPHRTNLDTGAYFTGVLAVGVFENDVPGGPVDLLWVP